MFIQCSIFAIQIIYRKITHQLNIKNCLNSYFFVKFKIIICLIKKIYIFFNSKSKNK